MTSRALDRSSSLLLLQIENDLPTLLVLTSLFLLLPALSFPRVPNDSSLPDLSAHLALPSQIASRALSKGRLTIPNAHPAIPPATMIKALCTARLPLLLLRPRSLPSSLSIDPLRPSHANPTSLAIHLPASKTLKNVPNAMASFPTLSPQRLQPRRAHSLARSILVPLPTPTPAGPRNTASTRSFDQLMKGTLEPRRREERPCWLSCF